jgi:hypothetical protein
MRHPSVLDHYRHIIVRYIGKLAIDLVEECAAARSQVEEDPFTGRAAGRAGTGPL